ncbi:MAG: helix-turn-helix domain-containing protein [Oscillospiraceae bacterium]|nr:helix-turn-helix domain-containing protein [Oscillospiraceae bacterium]
MKNQIRKARKAVGMTQEQLAKAIGITHATLSRYESGVIDPPSSQLKRIANVLKVSIFDLFDEKDQTVLNTGIDTGVGWGQTAYEQDLRYQGYSFSEAEHDLIRAFDDLNEEGQKKAIERVQELTEIPRYCRQNAPPKDVGVVSSGTPGTGAPGSETPAEPPAGPPGDTDTPTPPEGAEDAEGPQEGE